MKAHLTETLCHSTNLTVWDENGSGLGVVVKIRGSKIGRSWMFGFTTSNARGTLNPKPAQYRQMGLGSLARRPSLQELRNEVKILNGLVAQGIGPIEERRAMQKQAKQAKTVEQLAVHDLTIHFNTTWEKPASCRRAEKSAATRQRTTWVTHVLPPIGKMLVADIETSHINAILKSVRTTHGDNVAASVRGILNAALNRAKIWGFIPKGLVWDNPVGASTVISVKKRRGVVITPRQLFAAVTAAEQLVEKINPASRYGLSHIRQILAFLVATETGRRPGAIRGLQQRHVNLIEADAYLPKTKAKRAARNHPQQLSTYSDEADHPFRARRPACAERADAVSSSG